LQAEQLAVLVLPLKMALLANPILEEASTRADLEIGIVLLAKIRILRSEKLAEIVVTLKIMVNNNVYLTGLAQDVTSITSEETNNVSNAKTLHLHSGTATTTVVTEKLVIGNALVANSFLLLDCLSKLWEY